MDGSLPTQRVVVAPLSELAARVREAGPGRAFRGGDRRGGAAARDARLVREPAALRPPRARHAQPGAGAGAGGGPAARRRRARACCRCSRSRRPTDWREVDAALARRGGYDALLFTSANAVRALAARAAERGASLAALAPRVFCVGPGTAEAARRAGLEVHGVPERGRTARVCSSWSRGSCRRAAGASCSRAPSRRARPCRRVCARRARGSTPSRCIARSRRRSTPRRCASASCAGSSTRSRSRAPRPQSALRRCSTTRRGPRPGAAWWRRLAR